MKKFFENKPRAWFIIGSILVFLITVSGVGYIYLNKEVTTSPDVIAEVDGEEIMMSDFKSWLYGLDYSGTSENPARWETIKNDDSLKKSYLDMYLKEIIHEIETESLGITATEAEIDEKYNVPGSNYDNLTEEQKKLSRETTKAAIISQKLEDQALGWVTGDYILYRFDKYYSYEDNNKPIKGAGDEGLIATQKKYAEEKALAAYQRLINGESSIQQEVVTIQKDPVISYDAFAPLTPHINGTTSKEDYVLDGNLFDEKRYLGLRQNIANLKVDEVAQPFIIQTMVNSQMKDSAYVLFRAKEVKSGPYSNKIAWYEDLLEKYQVKIYYSNLGITNTEDKQYGFSDILKGLVPEAYAACPPTYTSTMQWTQLWGQLLVFMPDRVNYYAYPGARFRMAAGNSDAETDMMIYNADCTSHTHAHEVYKYAEDDGEWSGLMAGSGYYAVSGQANQMPALAECGSTRTANLGVYAPSNSAWIAGMGTLVAKSSTTDPSPYGNCCWNGVWGDAVNEIHNGLDMQGYNGLTIHYQYHYYPHYNNAPTPTIENPGTITVPSGSSTVGVSFTGYSIDPDGDKGKIQVMWKKTTDTQWKNFGSNDGAEDPTGSYTADANGVIYPNISAWGWSYNSIPAPADGWVINGYKIYYPAASLAPGNYVVAARAIDEHSRYGATWDLEYFSVAAPIVPALSCAVTPASGPVPLVITVNATPVNLPTSVFDYKFQTVGSTTPEELLGRGASIYYSLPSAGRYNAWVRNAGYLSNQWVSCTPAEVTVTDPTDSDGGEVAP